MGNSKGEVKKEVSMTKAMAKAIKLRPLVEAGGLSIRDAARLCGCSYYMYKKLVESYKEPTKEA